MHKKENSGFTIVKVDLEKLIFSVFLLPVCKFFLMKYLLMNFPLLEKLDKLTQFHHTCMFYNKVFYISFVFVDELLFFGKTNIVHMNIINNCLDVFCSSFEQKVLAAKTGLLVSRNVHNYRAMKLSRISGFRLASDLDKYLGVPMLHCKKKKETYIDLLEKTQLKQLLQLFLLIPCKLFCSQNRFVISWKKVSYYIAWNKFCLLKDVGGIDFRDLHLFNCALIMKLEWGLITNLNASKYGCIDQFIPLVRRIDHESEVWRDISSTWKSLLLGGRCVICDGRQ
ncbi:hypothetical protein CR513_13213, partial [Mucuna pruriens]